MASFFAIALDHRFPLLGIEIADAGVSAVKIRACAVIAHRVLGFDFKLRNAVALFEDQPCLPTIVERAWLDISGISKKRHGAVHFCLSTDRSEMVSRSAHDFESETYFADRLHVIVLFLLGRSWDFQLHDAQPATMSIVPFAGPRHVTLIFFLGHQPVIIAERVSLFPAKDSQ